MPILSFFPTPSKKPLIKIEIYPSVGGTLIYNGISQSPNWLNYNSTTTTITGTIEATDVGSYTAIFTPNDGYCWDDGSTEPYPVAWSISNATITEIPSQSNVLTYNGNGQLPTWNNYSENQLVLAVSSEINAGNYVAIFTPKSNYQWSDGSTSSKDIQWVINRASIASLPSQSNNLIYTGEELSPSWENYNETELAMSGDESGVTAGTYSTIFSPTSNYQWTDGSISSQSVNWYIERAVLSEVPSQINADDLIYNGDSLSPLWSEYPTGSLLLGGTLSAVNAGTYNAIFTLSENYKWFDDSLENKTSSWAISKAQGEVSLSETSITLDSSTKSKQITVTRLGDGAITAESSDSSVATVSISGTTLTITSISSGDITITVNVAEGTNYLAATTQCKVSVEIIGTLEETSWSLISKVSLAGNASNYWSVGDTKSVQFVGTICSTYFNDTFYVYILGFNHNTTYEGSDPSIHFGCFKTAQTNGIDICLTEGSSLYGTIQSTNTKSFRMNDSANYSGSGGWKDSDMRYSVLGSVDEWGETDASSTTATSPVKNTFMQALPSDLRDVMRPMTKYSDNIGTDTMYTFSEMSSMTLADYLKRMTATTDYLPLLSHSEVIGVVDTDEAGQEYNWGECFRCEQYTYYTNGNLKYKRRYYPSGGNGGTVKESTVCNYWTRSVSMLKNTENSWMTINTKYNNTTDQYSDEGMYSYGVAPIFKV